ncbi:MAG: ThiF family adenylyltransferase [Dermatophilaceae bacterium]
MRVDAWNLISEAAPHPATLHPDRPLLVGRFPAGPATVEVTLRHVLAGVGAVGTAVLQALWATPGVTGFVRAVDADREGVQETNLNRCVIFTGGDFDANKAVVAAALLHPTAGFAIEGMAGRAETHVDAGTHLISAVDTPAARRALQDRYAQSTVQASTRDLRVEMLRVDPTAGTAYLGCFNPPDAERSDDQFRAQVDPADRTQLATHADTLGVAEADVRDWVTHGGCGVIGDRMLERLRASNGQRAEFSVGFVSVMAGVLLAAQVVKDCLARAQGCRDDETEAAIDVPPLSGTRSRFVVSLLDPAATVTGVRAYLRDPECPSCAPGPRLDVWSARWTG